MTNKRIVLCADDYGQALTISQGILNLLNRNRLSAVSCVTNTSFWPGHAEMLYPYWSQIDVGLHFNLTEGQPISEAFRTTYGEQLPTLKKLMSKAFLHRLKKEIIVAECHAQLDRFEGAFGNLPHFLDGHQHVHQFPVIRDAIIDVYLARLRSSNTYVRIINNKISALDLLLNRKKIVIYLTGTNALKKRLKKNNIPYNQSFAGIYDFKKAANYRKLFKLFLKKIGNSGIIMCHPGLPGYTRFDPITAARSCEYQYLLSDDFLLDLASAGVEIERFT